MCQNARYNGKTSFEEWKKDWALEERYNFRAVERKWQKIWQDEGINRIESVSGVCDVDWLRGTNCTVESMADVGELYTPEEIIEAYGEDVFRLHKAFVGRDIATDESLNGIYRFIQRVFFIFSHTGDTPVTAKDLSVMNQTIIEVNYNLKQNKLHHGVSALMSYTNYLQEKGVVPSDMYAVLLRLITPFAPHIAEEMWARLGKHSLIVNEGELTGDVNLAQTATIKMAVLVNGKVRGEMEVARSLPKDKIIEMAKSLKNVAKQLAQNELKRIIVIPNRIVNIVVQ